MVTGLCRASQAPISGRTSWPATKGARICSAIFSIESKEIAPPEPLASSSTRSGVTTTPSMLDTEALVRAAGTLPPAIEVKAIEDCTVDGSSVR